MSGGLSGGGHPLHPALAHFPVAFWTAALGAEFAGWLSGGELWWLFSLACLVLGVASGLLAIAAGLVDYVAIPREHAAQDTAICHMVAMWCAWMLFVISLALRGLSVGTPPMAATFATAAGFAAMALGGWWGGRLVYVYGIGVAGSRDQTRRNAD